MTQIEKAEQSNVATKGVYEKPMVTTFGSVSKLTLSGGGSRADGSHTHRHG